MKKIHMLILAAVVIAFASGCKKDSVSPSVVGFWTGTYDGSSYYAMLFRSNGTVRVFADGTDSTSSDKAEGTYTVSDSVRTHYTYLTGGMYSYSTAAKWNDATMAGTYGDDNSTGGGGTFALTK